MNFLIQTARLALRPFAPEDAPYLFELNNDPEVIKYTGDSPFESQQAALEFILQYDQYQRYGMGRWTVLDKATGDYLGWCGLKYIPSLDEVDVGYRFMKKHWGKGYATESAAACLQYGFEKLGLTRIVGRAIKENVASVRVFEKIGMRFEAEINFEEHPGVLYVAETPTLSPTPARSG